MQVDSEVFLRCGLDGGVDDGDAVHSRVGGACARDGVVNSTATGETDVLCAWCVGDDKGIELVVVEDEPGGLGGVGAQREPNLLERGGAVEDGVGTDTLYIETVPCVVGMDGAVEVGRVCGECDDGVRCYVALLAGGVGFACRQKAQHTHRQEYTRDDTRAG